MTFATLLTDAAGPLGGRDYAALRDLSGVAPVTQRSGKSHIVVRCYAAIRGRSHSCGRALRGVADQMLGVACVLLQRRVLFDPNLNSDRGTPAAP